MVLVLFRCVRFNYGCRWMSCWRLEEDVAVILVAEDWRVARTSVLLGGPCLVVGFWFLGGGRVFLARHV